MKQTISFVITNTGDGANGLVWFNHSLTDEQRETLLDSDTEYFGSGDGLQYRELQFPEGFDVSEWAKSNYLHIETYSDYMSEYA